MDRHACRLLLLQFLLGGPLLAGDPAVLQIRVTQGEQSAYRAGSETRNAFVVEVTDDASHPVEGVAISFRLPPAGPGGQFMNGLGSEIVFTGADGRAVMPPVRWNRTLGAFDIRITAAKGTTRAGLLAPQSIVDSEAGQTAMVMVNPRAGEDGSGRKWLRRTLIVAGVAAATVAILAVTRKSNSSASTTSTSSNVTISPPTIVIGAPE